MTDKELITRLNNLFWMLEEDGHYTKANTARFAKDRIEAHAAEIERLKAALQTAVKVVEKAVRRRGEAEAELARLIQKQGGGDA